MQSRRNFLLKGSLAATAALALRPFETLAGITSPFMGSYSSVSKLLLLHTGCINTSLNPGTIATINNSDQQMICLHAGRNFSAMSSTFSYDASACDSGEPSAIEGDYKIIKKGYLKIGIINAKPDDDQVINKMESLSTYLKQEKKCHIVLCLSQLGYKNNNVPDDLTLANKTTHLDIIIGGHEQNFHAHPVISLNSADKEVVIHSATQNSLGCGIINIDFDGKGQKRSISFTT